MTAEQRAQKYHPTGHWDEQRTHDDGKSYWRDGKLHRSDGPAVDRDSLRQVWLFGKLIPDPELAESIRPRFAGQSKTGFLDWVDGDGFIRARSHLTADNAFVTEYFDCDGNREPHWRGGYNVRVEYETGERRYFTDPGDGTPKMLHRMDGPAIEMPATATMSVQRSKWVEHGQKVDGPVELFIRHRMHVQRFGQLSGPPELTEQEAARLRAHAINHFDTPIAEDVALTFVDEYAKVLELLEGIEVPEPVFNDAVIEEFLNDQQLLLNGDGVELLAGDELTIADLLGESPTL